MVAVGLRESFHVEQPLATVWSRLQLPAQRRDGCRVPGFPSDDGKPGCAAAIVSSVPQRSLRLRKEDAPCAGSEIAIDIGPANAGGWPTRVTVAQSNLPPPMATMPDMAAAHWRRIVADFRLHLECGAPAPAAAWRADLGAAIDQTRIGVRLASVAPGGFAERCGMAAGDLLLTLRGARIYDIGELWAVLAACDPAEEDAVAWVRGGRIEGARAAFASAGG